VQYLIPNLESDLFLNPLSPLGIGVQEEKQNRVTADSFGYELKETNWSNRGFIGLFSLSP